MAGFSISNLQQRMPVGNQVTQADQSRQLLTDYKAHLTTANGVKSGVMYIGTRNGDTRIYRDHALNFRSRKGEAFTQMSAQIKDHFQQAYQGKVPPKQFDQLMKQVDVYLGQRHGGMGTQSFVRMVDAFERGAMEQTRLEQAGARTLDGDVAQLIQGRALPKAEGSVPVVDPRGKLEIKVDNMASALRRIVGPQNQSAVEPLGRGAAAQAYLAQQAGQDRVFTLPVTAGMPEIPRNDWRHGEMAAATAKAPLDHVAKPDSFVLLVSRSMTDQLSHTQTGDKSVTLQADESAFYDLQAYEVPANKLEEFMQSLPDGASVQQAAVRMPLASGKNIHELTKKEPLSTEQFHQLQAGLYLAANEMHGAGLVHRDIKPANVMMDPEGRVKAVDLGSTDGVDAQGKAREATGGTTPAYIRPDLLWEDASAAPGASRLRPVIADAANDRYACAMTLMTSLAPGLDLANPDGRMALKAYQASQDVPPGSSFGARFVSELMSGALEFANAPPKGSPDDIGWQKSVDQKAQIKASVEQLTARLQAEPELRQSLEQMFNASLPGEAGDAAWEALRAGALATASLPESDRKALNQMEMDRAIDGHLAANPNMLPGEASRLRELASKNISGDFTLSPDDARDVVGQSAQVAEQQRLASQQIILGGAPSSLRPGDPVYQSRRNFLGEARAADYE